MRCHYEVLGVERDADVLAIKKAFRLQALRWHPDKHQKNGISSEEATEQFQGIQNAYEVLSDAHERKWYDDHREQILRGDDGGGEADEDELNLFRYFSASVYSGFGTDDKSFYSVYGQLFQKIDALDRESGGEAPAPMLGTGKADKDKVNNFYQHWKSYTTPRNFAYVDEYKTTDAPTRQVRRAMEKENKKLRDAARKAFTSEVRELVDFVCRRDPRVRALQKQKEKEKERRRVEEEAKKREKQAAYDAERLAFQQQEQERWASESMETSRLADQDIQQEMAKLRKKLDSDVLLCDLCSKTFKSTKQLQNHLTSKKHREKEQELGVFSDMGDLEEEMEKALREELLAAGKLKENALDPGTRSAETPESEPTESKENHNSEVNAAAQQEEEEAALQKQEAERVRLEKEEKAAEKRRERKEKRKEKKKENVDKIVSNARSKKEKVVEEEGRGQGKKKGGKKRRG